MHVTRKQASRGISKEAARSAAVLGLTMLATLGLAARPAAAQTYTFANFDEPGATLGTVANGINDSGQVAGYYQDSTGVFGYVVTPGAGGDYAGGVFATFNDSSAIVNTEGNGINASGQVVGTYNDSVAGSGGIHGFVATPGAGGDYAGGSYSNFDDPNAIAGTTYAKGINGLGQVVGSSEDPNTGDFRGFVVTPGMGGDYANGAFTTLVDPDAVGHTEARGINDAGEIFGLYLDGSGDSFSYVLTPGTGGDYASGVFTTLDDPDAQSASFTYAEGINNAGQIVGFYQDSGGGYHGFVETPGAGGDYANGAFANFDFSDPAAFGPNTVPSGINASGQIVGIYNDSSFTPHGFVATPAPEPSQSLALSIGLLGLGGLALKSCRRQTVA